MELNKAIERRHSSRSFSKKPASFKDVMLAIDYALQGPFAGNINNIKFLIVENPTTIKKIAEHSNQSWIEESSLVVVVCSDDSFLEKQYDERGIVYSRQQAGATIMTFLLKLTDLELDSCWVGAFNDDPIKNVLGIPASKSIEAIVPIGYENSKKARKKPKKHSLERSIFWEEWDKTRRPAFFEDPDITHRDAF